MVSRKTLEDAIANVEKQFATEVKRLESEIANIKGQLAQAMDVLLRRPAPSRPPGVLRPESRKLDP